MALAKHFQCSAHDLERYSDFYDEDRINRAFAYMQGEAAAQKETTNQAEQPGTNGRRQKLSRAFRGEG